jgi:hypothetical protein
MDLFYSSSYSNSNGLGGGARRRIQALGSNRIIIGIEDDGHGHGLSIDDFRDSNNRINLNRLIMEMGNDERGDRDPS